MHAVVYEFGHLIVRVVELEISLHLGGNVEACRREAAQAGHVKWHRFHMANARGLHLEHEG